MILSLSESVRLLVRNQGVLKLKEGRKFQGCFEEVSRVFQGSFKDVLRKFQGCFTKVSRVF